MREREHKGGRRLDKFAAEQAERGDPSLDPRRVLNNGAEDPIADEWPDPNDRRPDPRAPYSPEEEPPAPGLGTLGTGKPRPRRGPEDAPARERKRNKRDRH